MGLSPFQDADVRSVYSRMTDAAPREVVMKRSLLTGFRAFAFALGVFVLLVLGDIRIPTARDVTLFILGLAALWVLIEMAFLNVKAKQRPRKP